MSAGENGSANEECGCRLLIERPCPHGDTYTWACGHDMREISETEPL